MNLLKTDVIYQALRTKIKMILPYPATSYIIVQRHPYAGSPDGLVFHNLALPGGKPGWQWTSGQSLRPDAKRPQRVFK
jgi:hypothetical protein